MSTSNSSYANFTSAMMEDEDLGSDYDEEIAPGPKKAKRSNGSNKGKKVSSPAGSDAAGPTSRKMQNRLAQREFRQRKLAYVKELEAKVEFLSTSTDEQLETLKHIMKGLIEENHQLRKVMQSVAGFVGQGAGGQYGRLGFLSAEAFDTWVDAPQSDTLERLYNEYKATKENKGAEASSSNATSKRHDDPSPAQSPAASLSTSTSTSTPSSVQQQSTTNRKRSRDSVPVNPLFAMPPQASSSAPPAQSTFSLTDFARPPNTSSAAPTAPMPFQLSSSSQLNLPSNAMSHPSTSSFFFDIQDPVTAYNNSFTHDFLTEFASTGFTPSFDINNTSGYSAPFDFNSATSPANFVSQDTTFSAAPSPTDTVRQMSTGLGSRTVTQRTSHPPQSVQGKKYEPGKLNIEFLVQSTPLLQALHLISYHKRNKRADPSYVLPPQLQPTQLQQTVPHDERIDGILLPDLRDALIRESSNLDLSDVFEDMLQAVTVHPSDNPIDPSAWEVQESWLRQYPQLATEDMLRYTNRWRRARGEKDIVL